MSSLHLASSELSAGTVANGGGTALVAGSTVCISEFSTAGANSFIAGTWMGATHAVAGSKLAIVQSDASPMNSSCALPSVWSTLMGRSMAAGAVHAIDLESPARKLSTASRSDRTEAQTASPSTNRFLPNVAALSEKHSHRLLGGVTGPIGFKGYTMIYTICFSFARTGPAKPAVLKHILFYEAAKGQQTGPRPTAAAPHARMQRPVAGLMAVPPLHEKCGMAPGSPLEVNYIL